MVWNSTQSALYKAVDDYNSRVISGENCREKYIEKTPEKCTEKVPEKCCENCSKNDVNFDQKFGENCECISREKNAEKCSKKFANFKEKIDENCAEKCPKFTENFCKNCPKNDTFSRLFSDKDFLLVAGLILVLLNEKADLKLILALAIVLLG
ncbi:MAG: hypothetical protein ACI4JZ_04895 [Oscillospiraceae bacterium]